MFELIRRTEGLERGAKFAARFYEPGMKKRSQSLPLLACDLKFFIVGERN